MKVTFIRTKTKDGVIQGDYMAGETHEVPDDFAASAIMSGWAMDAKDTLALEGEHLAVRAMAVALFRCNGFSLVQCVEYSRVALGELQNHFAFLPHLPGKPYSVPANGAAHA